MNNYKLGMFLLCVLLVVSPVSASPPDGCAGRYTEPRRPTENDPLPAIAHTSSWYDKNEGIQYFVAYLRHGEEKTSTWFERYESHFYITITHWQADCGEIDAPFAWATVNYLNGDLSAFDGYIARMPAFYITSLDRIRSYRVMLPNIEK